VCQFNSPLIFILLFALAFDVGVWVDERAQGWPIEASAIALILLFNAALGLYQEQRSEAALSRLKALAGAHAWALRNGEFIRVPTQDLALATAHQIGIRGVRVLTVRISRTIRTIPFEPPSQTSMCSRACGQSRSCGWSTR
jgi:hypothetical protein